jgi:hypothetical protein
MNCSPNAQSGEWWEAGGKNGRVSTTRFVRRGSSPGAWDASVGIELLGRVGAEASGRTVAKRYGF